MSSLNHARRSMGNGKVFKVVPRFKRNPNALETYHRTRELTMTFDGTADDETDFQKEGKFLCISLWALFPRKTLFELYKELGRRLL